MLGIGSTPDSSEPERGKRDFSYVPSLLGYLVLTLIVTDPLIARFTTHNAGSSGDDLQYMWNMWWAKHSVLDLGQNPFYTDFIFYPYNVSLAFHAHIPINSLLSVPFQSFMGLPAIYNMFTLLSFVLSGLGAFLLLKDITGEWKTSLIGGCFYSFCADSMHLINVGMIHWVPSISCTCAGLSRPRRSP
jgi:hypothetical protein